MFNGLFETLKTIPGVEAEGMFDFYRCDFKVLPCPKAKFGGPISAPFPSHCCSHQDGREKPSPPQAVEELVFGGCGECVCVWGGICQNSLVLSGAFLESSL